MPTAPVAAELETEKFKTLRKNWFEVIKMRVNPLVIILLIST